MAIEDGYDAGGVATAIEPSSSTAAIITDAECLRTAPNGGRDADW